jgi:paired amphipathic helix protein Sin3a
MKTLISEITTKHQEQAGRRLNPAAPIPDYQFMYPVHDVDVLLDATRILCIALGHSSTNSGPDKDKMDGFLRSFIPLFFGFSQRYLDEKLRNAPGRGNNDDDTDDAATDISSHANTIRHHFSVKENLLKDVLKRKTSTRGGSRRVSRTTSRETSPGASVTHDEDVHMEGSETDPNSGIKTWVRAPGAHLQGMKPSDQSRPGNANLPVKRTTFTLFCNNQIYAFIRTFYLLYTRLLDIKNCEAQAARDIYNRKHATVAKELGIVISSPEDFFRDTGPDANYYKQVVEMCESFILGELDSPTFEDGLRQVYIQKGWQLYTIDKLSAAVLKYAHTIVNSEKMGDAILLFQRDRHRKEYVPETSEYMYVIDYRAKVDRLFEGEEHMFKVEWVSYNDRIIHRAFTNIVVERRDERHDDPAPDEA